MPQFSSHPSIIEPLRRFCTRDNHNARLQPFSSVRRSSCGISTKDQAKRDTIVVQQRMRRYSQRRQHLQEFEQWRWFRRAPMHLRLLKCQHLCAQLRTLCPLKSEQHLQLRPQQQLRLQRLPRQSQSCLRGHDKLRLEQGTGNCQPNRSCELGRLF